MHKHVEIRDEEDLRMPPFLDLLKEAYKHYLKREQGAT